VAGSKVGSSQSKATLIIRAASISEFVWRETVCLVIILQNDGIGSEFVVAYASIGTFVVNDAITKGKQTVDPPSTSKNVNNHSKSNP